MKDSKAEGLRWLHQAESDLRFAQLGLREGFYAQVCFQCQQICEKAIKAIRYGGGERTVYGHSLVELTDGVELFAGFREELALLDQYYIPTRYPNGLPGGTPSDAYSQRQAKDAVDVATSIVDLVRRQLG